MVDGFTVIMMLISPLTTIASRILMVSKPKFVFGFLNLYNLTSYQTRFNNPNIPNQTYQTKLHDLSKYTVPTSFVGIAVPTKVVGMLLVLALPTKVMGMQARNQIQESKGSDFH